VRPRTVIEEHVEVDAIALVVHPQRPHPLMKKDSADTVAEEDDQVLDVVRCGGTLVAVGMIMVKRGVLVARIVVGVLAVFREPNVRFDTMPLQEAIPFPHTEQELP